MGNVFLWFSVLFGLAVFLGIVFRRLGQTPLLAYVIVGIVAGEVIRRLGFDLEENFNLLSSMGVMLLLFLVGLEMRLFELKRMGSRVFVVAILQMILGGLVLIPLIRFLGVDFGAALITGLALVFSSTVLAVKLLSEGHDLESLSGRLAVGILVIQDLAAVGLLLALPKDNNDISSLVIKVGVVVGITALLSWKLLPRLVNKLASSTDELILFSLAWCLVLAGVVASPFVGLSLEVGGFLAGLALSGTLEHSHIAVKIKPLRDFFLTIFFVSLGMSLRLESRVFVGGVLLSLVVLLVKPMVSWIILRMLGFANRTAFMTALVLGQVSEFSLIITLALSKANLVSQEIVGLVAEVVLISMAVSAFLLVHKEAIYRKWGRRLTSWWKDEEGGGDFEVRGEDFENHVVLLGCHRMGKSLLSFLESVGDQVIIVDFDPVVVSRLLREKKRAVFADAADPEIYDKLNLKEARLIVSTVKDINDSLVLLREVKKRRLKVPVVVDAESVEDAERLYEAGASYVVFPHFVGGLHLAELIEEGKGNTDWNKSRLRQEKLLKNLY